MNINIFLNCGKIKKCNKILNLRVGIFIINNKIS